MATTRTRPHIQVPVGRRSAEPYTAHASGGGSKTPGAPELGRPAHAVALRSSIESAVDTAKLRRTAAGFSVTGAKPGVYLEFESLPGWELALGSMERRRAKDSHKHIEVVAVSERKAESDSEPVAPRQHAAVFVPDGKVSHFLERLEKYGQATQKKEGERRHENLFDRIADVRLATLHALHGHGTRMAGLALFGDLTPLLEDAGPVVLSHQLESVKILPPKGANDPDLYGAVTLLVQDSIRPFFDGKTREIHIHELPWPRDVLASLRAADVHLRVTLSYFVEPNPGRRGWQSKHRYQSHGLRFEVKQPAESLDEFRKRLNKEALDDDESKPSSSESGDWCLGQARRRGSLHADTLTLQRCRSGRAWGDRRVSRDRLVEGARETRPQRARRSLCVGRVDRD